MVDVSDKPQVSRQATAVGSIKLKKETINRIREETTAKGNPLYTAKIAGILAAKKTSELIPLCHPLPLMKVELETRIKDDTTAEVRSVVKTKAQTGVEMEALAATSVALLTIWDMVKQYEKDERGQYPQTRIENIRVEEKIKDE